MEKLEKVENEAPLIGICRLRNFYSEFEWK